MIRFLTLSTIGRQICLDIDALSTLTSFLYEKVVKENGNAAWLLLEHSVR
jgi:hypothetical protein